MKTFAELYELMKDTAEYKVEALALTFTESVLLRMEDLGNLSRKQLAERMGVSEAYVSKILKGTSNFTFASLVKLGEALDCHIEAPLLIPKEKEAEATPVSFVRFPFNPKAFRPREVSTMPTVEPENDDTETAAAA